MKTIRVWVLALMAVWFVAACGDGGTSASAPKDTEASVSASVSASGDASGDTSGGEVVIYNWTEYLPEEAIRMFEEETGIKVVYSTYESNEAMYSKVKLMGGEGYDIVVPSTYYVSKMAREELLAPIDRDKLTNFEQINPAMLGRSYDPVNAYSVPYLWGGTGILYDNRVVEPVTSWKALWKPEYAGKVLMQDDLREVLGIGLLLNGHSMNSKDKGEIEQAYATMSGMAGNVLVYNSDSPKVPFLNEEVQIGMIWNGEAFMAQEEGEHLEFVWPEEGGILWMDNFVVLKGAKNYDNALKFIDFMLRPDIAAMCCEEYGYPTPNMGALKLLPEELVNNPVVFPPDEVVQHSEFQDDVGEAIVTYEMFWEKLRAMH